ncbi:class I SAM-dependent methyltransferase [Novosphingobium album (ex Hu et al. 2023)]|uniref:Methyltransferase n=1 Tax=Novosphingobium album (ex Hu et al. 2023) TaxID=2930093 RepID=A0ABT0B0U8_9SPHN|nr:methyltransferase [Novosphingobium album (ex Hu et al. 2023)]MCJ2178546.1 methyltransferase [Novosphingobium album (ex Hu et al. 2023)]
MPKIIPSLTITALLLASPAAVMAGDTPVPVIAAAVADSARPAEDVARDAQRKPAELMTFAGVHEGARIAELAPGGGYYTRLLSLAVGAEGHVFADSSRPVPAVEAWATEHPQVSISILKAGDDLASEPVDIVWTTENYHDFKNAKIGESDAAALYNQAAFRALKPGGVYLINDHAAAADAPADVTSTLHRIAEATVIREVEAAGFQLAGKSPVLANPEDDHTLKVFDPAIRGKTDQFVLKFVKPES